LNAQGRWKIPWHWIFWEESILAGSSQEQLYVEERTGEYNRFPQVKAELGKRAMYVSREF